MSRGSEIRDGLELVFAFVVPVFAILLLHQNISNFDLSIPGASSDGFAECQSAECWILSEGSITARALPLRERVPIHMGDQLITTSPDSRMVAALRKGEGQLSMSGLSILTVSLGRRDLDMKPENDKRQEEAGRAFPNIDKKELSQVLFIGGVPLKVNTPFPNSSIVAQRFPAQIPFVFTVPESALKSGDVVHRFERWTLSAVKADKSMEKVSTLSTRNTPVHEGQVFMGSLSLSKPGDYVLAPASEEIDLDQAELLKFSVKPSQDLEQQIKGLLDKARNDDNGASFEIRQ